MEELIKTDNPVDTLGDKSVVMCKVPYCKVCNGWVRSAVTEYLEGNKKAKKEFAMEAFDYNLLVKDMTIQEHAALAKSGNHERCTCEN